LANILRSCYICQHIEQKNDKKMDKIYFPLNLSFLRKQKGVSQTALADMLGLGRTTISAYENGKTQTNTEYIARIARYFGVSINDLLICDLSRNPERLKVGNMELMTVTVNAQNENTAVVVNEKAAAGYPDSCTDAAYLADLETVDLPTRMFDQRTRTIRVFEVVGDSMDPEYKPGSFVFTERITLDEVTGTEMQGLTQRRRAVPAIKDGDPCVVVSPYHGVVLKNLYYRRQSDRLLLVSTNKTFSPYEIPLNEIREIWKVRAFFHKL